MGCSGVSGDFSAVTGVAQEGLDPASTLIPSNGQGPDGEALCLLHIAPDLTKILCPRGPGTN